MVTGGVSLGERSGIEPFLGVGGGGTVRLFSNWLSGKVRYRTKWWGAKNKNGVLKI